MVVIFLLCGDGDGDGGGDGGGCSGGRGFVFYYPPVR